MPKASFPNDIIIFSLINVWKTINIRHLISDWSISHMRKQIKILIMEVVKHCYFNHRCFRKKVLILVILFVCVFHITYSTSTAWTSQCHNDSTTWWPSFPGIQTTSAGSCWVLRNSNSKPGSSWIIECLAHKQSQASLQRNLILATSILTLCLCQSLLRVLDHRIESISTCELNLCFTKLV